MKDFFCVNALSGETSFLREFTIEELVEELIVSMPYRAKHHFYLYKLKKFTSNIVCQCPIGRNIISTKMI